MTPTQISVGPFQFEYDREARELHLKVGAGAWWTSERVSEQEWLAFYALASTPGAQGAPQQEGPQEAVVTFLYVLMRDHLPVGTVAEILNGHDFDGEPDYTSTDLEALARRYAGTLA